MSEYTVTFSIARINAMCNCPKAYQRLQLKEAMRDADTHYKHHYASKAWRDQVIRILNDYT